MSDPNVTIVVVPREQFSVAERSLETIYACTPEPFRLVYVDGNSPAQIRRYLERQSVARGFTLLRSANYLSPNRARNWAAEHLATDYVVFVDNDLLVSPGWLSPLVTCAEQTGAWAVGPLYLEGDPEARIIHMAGGACGFEGAPPHRQFHTSHLLQKTGLDELTTPLTRGPCDFVEFHCMLLRRTALEQLGPLDESLLNTREHLDVCLQIHAAGGSVYFEPRSVVTYRSPPPLARADVPYFLLRWSEDWTRRSLRRFVDKYGLDPRYLERATIAASRRSIVFAPVSAGARRIVGTRGAQWLHAAMSRAERIVNRLVVRGHAGREANA